MTDYSDSLHSKKPNTAYEHRAGCPCRGRCEAGPDCFSCMCSATPAVEPEQRKEARREFMVQHKGAYEALVDEPEQMTCPLCNKPVERDLSGTNPEVAYMDGWHHTACLDRYNAEPEQAYTDEQADELAASMRDTTSATCLPDCQGDCPVCLPPEEYDKLHGTTTNPHCGWCDLASMKPECIKSIQATERARIVRIIEGRKKPHPCVWNEWMDDLLAAIRGEGDDA